MYKIERWTARGVVTETAPTKKEANRRASLLRNEEGTVQTIVVKPNGDVRVCRALGK